MYSGWAFVDVDGTLIDANGEARPHIKQLTEKIKELNLILVVWSGAGKEYAREVTFKLANKDHLNFRHIDHFMWKGTPIQWSHIKPIWFVDDSGYIEKEHKTDGERVFRVPFYNKERMSDDKWLWDASIDVVDFMSHYHKGGLKVLEDAVEIFGSSR